MDITKLDLAILFLQNVINNYVNKDKFSHLSDQESLENLQYAKDNLISIRDAKPDKKPYIKLSEEDFGSIVRGDELVIRCKRTETEIHLILSDIGYDKMHEVIERSQKQHKDNDKGKQDMNLMKYYLENDSDDAVEVHKLAERIVRIAEKRNDHISILDGYLLWIEYSECLHAHYLNDTNISDQGIEDILYSEKIFYEDCAHQLGYKETPK